MGRELVEDGLNELLNANLLLLILEFGGYSLLLDHLLGVSLIRYVFHRVMPEVEVLSLVNRLSYPKGELRTRQTRLVLGGSIQSL